MNNSIALPVGGSAAELREAVREALCVVPGLTTLKVVDPTLASVQALEWALRRVERDGTVIALDNVTFNQCTHIGSLPALVASLGLPVSLFLPFPAENMHHFSSSQCLQISGLGPVPEQLGFLQALQDLTLTDVTSIGSSLSNLTQLTSLQMAGCGEFPVVIGQLTSLKKLSFSGNAPAFNGAVPDAIGLLTNLRSLRLSQVSAQLPDSIGNLQQLTMLQLLSMGMAELPEGMSRLSCLEVLHMRSCIHVRLLPPWLSGYRMLHELSVAFSAIDVLPAGVLLLPQLECAFFFGCYMHFVE
eukprot:CAMPEP_0114622606 /NCGR_PEP_ID=MMETSP0168-20121206/9824_1 /TAXON_ID=95228 ORGANISM="Vannella sp., Strain DIVA3 517/6/12" /NCGR_SAMPLE_ID=MMETSP0168 /ASSEMBLY_ACC=CAM_ASM_000044 /LENGTH=299 /DNA_ID=CAMNT_0001833827 /DNA_START=28 /DNA_END=924 /DNA_ORIENTATION=+